MKYLIPLLIITCAPLASSETANQFFKQGEAALKKGDITTAKASYLKALKVDPNHGNSKYRLASMKELTASASVTARKVRMEKIILPNVSLEEISLEESLDILSAMIEKESEKAFTPNFVITDPSGSIAKKKVNLRLRNIPATVALKYVLTQTKARDSWDAHVINILPVGEAKAAQPATQKKE